MGIKDVAREAGVSTATVAHVVNGTRYVSDETRRRVLDAIERCGYSPSARVRNLASGRDHTLGVIVSDIADPFFSQLAKDIQAAALERGYDVVLADAGTDPERTSHYAELMLRRRVAGLLLMTPEIGPDLAQQLARRRVAGVFYNYESAGDYRANIVVGAEVGIDEAINHLIALGHGGISYIGGPSRSRTYSQRLETFLSCVSRRPPGSRPRIYESEPGIGGGRRAAREMLTDGEPHTAVMVADDLMALGVIEECRARGRAIPGDISVVGFNDIAFSALSDPPLTTVSLPDAVLARRAVETLMSTIESPHRRGAECRIPTHLTVRGSTGPARMPRPCPV